ncbi:MAG TPA: hypothetical protein DCR93_29975 [Cytophagales bacterium]|nr:hypothetical protein [Cytophagales bacterium]HAP63542.1 hypothetical protein [Cytophagales bacterium]
MISPLKQMILDYEAGTMPFERVAQYALEQYDYQLTQSELDSYKHHMILEDFLRQIHFSRRLSSQQG